MRKTALYIRVSTEAQAEEGYSIEAQKEMLSSFCKMKGIKVYEFYIDGGFTGSNIDRPELQRLVSHVKNNKIDKVVVYKIDRLSRSQKDTLYLIEDIFSMNNTEFISLNENLDTSTPIGRAMLGIMSAFAQLERETIRERTRIGMKERVKSGLWMGGGRVPFGYDYNKNKGILVKNKDSEKVVQIYDLFLKGYSLQKIANMLGLKYEKLAAQIITRKTNAGYICYNGEEYRGQHEPIVTLDTYAQAMEILKERSVKKIVDSEHLLQGILYCGKCGAKMRYQKWGKKGYKMYCYSQQKYKMYLVKDPNCDNLKVWADDIEDTVVKDLLNMTWNNTLETNDPGRLSLSILELLQQQLNIHTEKLRRLYKLYSVADDDILLQTINSVKEDISKINKQIINEQVKQDISTKLSDTKNMLKDVANIWDYMSSKEKQNIIRNIVDKVVVIDNNVKVFYKLIGKLITP